VDPEFQRALVFVLVGGIAVVTVGAAALFLVFRTFGGKEAGKPWHIALMVAVIAFVFLCCLVLLMLSYAARR
jgi:uncharacterized membrane protein YidH (DUF202 family)